MPKAVESRVQQYRDHEGWTYDENGILKDTRNWSQLSAAHRAYATRRGDKIAELFKPPLRVFLNCASGPFTANAMAYSKNYSRCICVDISVRALSLCRQKLGERGMYLCSSMVRLSLPDGVSDGTLCEHALYHVDKADQETAVRELIRVTKLGKPLVVIYSNPLSPLNILEGLYRWSRLNKLHGGGKLYLFRYRPKWWRRFEDSCEVEIGAFDPISARQAKLLLPTAALSRWFFRCCGWLEQRHPRVATHLWSYPVIVLKKRRGKIL